MEKETMDRAEEYRELMKNTVIPEYLANVRWEKEGGNYKQFSIYDYSQYSTETKTALSIEDLI